MPDGFRIAEAYVTVTADTSKFADTLRGDLDKESRGQGVKISVAPDVSGFADKLREDLDSESRGDGVKVGITPDTSGFKEKLDADLVADRTADVKVKVDPDPAGFGEKLKADTAGPAADAGATAGTGFAGRFSDRFSTILGGAAKGGGTGGDTGGGGSGGLFGGLKTSSGDAGGQAGGLFGNKFVSGTTFGKSGAIVTGVGSALALLPAMAGVQGTLMGGMMAARMAAALLAQNPQITKAFKNVGPELMKTLQEAVAPLVPVVLGALKQVSGFLKAIGPQLQSMFSELGPMIMPVLRDVESVATEVISFMKAAIPGLEPLIEGILSLVKGVLPGLIAIVKATVPAMHEFGQILAEVGGNIGSMLKSMAPAVEASMGVLKVVASAVGGLLPIIGKLAAVFATSLAPVLASLMGAFKALEPSIMVFARILASLAGAVLSSVTGLLTSLFTVIKSIAPAVSGLAKSFGLVFTTLENNGVLFEVEDALEDIAKPLGNLISALLTGLAPILPLVFKGIGEIAGALAAGLAKALLAIMPLLTMLVTALSRGLAAVLPVIIPLIVRFASLFTGALATTIALIASALAAVLRAVPPTVLSAIAVAIAAVVAGIKLWAIAQTALNVVLAANPFGLVVVAIGLLVVAVVELVKHWQTVAAFFKTVWDAVYNTFEAAINLIVGYLAGSWNKMYAGIKSAWSTISGFFISWWNTLYGFFSTIVSKVISFYASSWNTIYNTIKSTWNSISGWFQSWWNTLYSTWSNTVSTIKTLLANAWTSVKDTAVSAWNSIETAFSTIWNSITSGFRTAVSTIGQVWNSLESLLSGPWNWLVTNVFDKIKDVWNDIAHIIPGMGKIAGFAAGGKIPGYGGGDILPALLEPGETVVSKEHSQKLAGVFKAVGVPGYATGGKAGNPAPAPSAGLGGGIIGDVTHALSDIWHDITSTARAIIAGTLDPLKALDALLDYKNIGDSADAKTLESIPAAAVPAVANALESLITAYLASSAGGGGSSSSIVSYAESFLGKIPYKWGGESISGADCSGFTSLVYKHSGFGGIPRTSEAQGAWVTKTSKPQAGGLAFFNSPAGGPPPGHVGIIVNESRMIDQAGPEGVKGPTGDPLTGYMFVGVPPGGFAGPGGISGPANLAQIEKWWIGAGGPGGMTAHIAAAITGAESSFNVKAVQKGQPYATTGWGLWQITPGDSEPSAGINQQLLTGPSNAKAAVLKYRGAGDTFSPWTTYEDGAYKAFMSAGGLIPAGAARTPQAQWYDRGGQLMPGVTTAVNTTGRPETVVPNSGGINMVFNGTQWPTPEQMQAMSLMLTTAVSNA